MNQQFTESEKFFLSVSACIVVVLFIILSCIMVVNNEQEQNLLICTIPFIVVSALTFFGRCLRS